VIFIPVVNVEEDESELDDITRRLPDLLNRFDSPIPCVIGTYLDAIRGGDLEAVCGLLAGVFWEDMNKFNDVLLCSPVEYVSAKFVLDYIENHGSKPPFEDVWKEQLDPRYWVRRGRSSRSLHNTEMAFQCLRKCFASGKGAEYDEVSTERIRELMVEFQEPSQVAPTLSAYYQAIAAPSFCEKAANASTRQLAKVFEKTVTSLE